MSHSAKRAIMLRNFQSIIVRWLREEVVEHRMASIQKAIDIML